MAGMVRSVTVAVIVYTTLHVIISLETAPAVLDGRGSLATHVSYSLHLRLVNFDCKL